MECIQTKKNYIIHFNRVLPRTFNIKKTQKSIVQHGEPFFDNGSFLHNDYKKWQMNPFDYSKWRKLIINIKSIYCFIEIFN